ncbi:hypothetical protein [Flavobacterium myungsuense]|uniref:hypothetical protein n=1 Tax=Flavobacterium myungsuense TaxID=651823 RepID=UPI0036D2D680
MRSYFIYFLLFSTLLTAQRQKKKAIEVDSVSYYVELSNFNVKVNNYKSSLDFAQKAIDFALNKKDNKQGARSYAVLASLYFDLKNMMTP